MKTAGVDGEDVDLWEVHRDHVGKDDRFSAQAACVRQTMVLAERLAQELMCTTQFRFEITTGRSCHCAVTIG
jgi:hypothetical protein